MTIDFDDIRETAVRALEDSDYKDELDALLDEFRDLFVDDAESYLERVVSTFIGDGYDPAQYSAFVDALDDDQLVAEAGATADQIAGLAATYSKKKQFLEDLKNSASLVVRNALIAALTTSLDPAAE